MESGDPSSPSSVLWDPWVSNFVPISQMLSKETWVGHQNDSEVTTIGYKKSEKTLNMLYTCKGLFC